MAVRQVLAELTAAYAARSGVAVAVESVGGVDAARRVQAGERCDFVVLAADAIDQLVAAGHLAAGSRVDLVRSPVAVAVRAGAPRPDIATEDAVRRAVLAARSLCCSTGPSGTHLRQVFERWGVAAQLQGRLVQAPPGVPVGTLVARGEVELGFQQLSELIHLDGIDVLGTLPPAIETITVFAAGVPPQADPAVHALLAFLNSPPAAEVKRRHGLTPA
ncbi:MAG: substrate-binding domain-containing protein [Burkholderiales bacterium]|nr:substrate-binding domain-containing protein [Burkholderiales bacterium]MDE2274658.1 substrate-binding domain-containing protein [Burkholderiales bacterium]